MKFKLIVLLSFLAFNFPIVNFAQIEVEKAFFTSEAKIIATNSGVFVSIKKYNATQGEIENAIKPPNKGPMNFLNVPFEATKISLYNKEFESKLYLINSDGLTIWDKTLGFSKNTTASPVMVYEDFVLAGESVKNEDKISIEKIDYKGNTIWKTGIDSLENIHGIMADKEKVYALASFDAVKKVFSKDGSFHFENRAVYYHLQLNAKTGAIISKKYQDMANYLSSLNFVDPYMNSRLSYYLNNKDSALFLSSQNLESATVVSEEMKKGNSIVKLTASPASCHLLTLINKKENKNFYNIFSNFYGDKKTVYESEIPLEAKDSDRSFIFNIQNDSIATIIGTPKKNYVFITNRNGETKQFKTIDEIYSPIVGATVWNDKIYILQVPGRIKPGVMGRLKINVY